MNEPAERVLSVDAPIAEPKSRRRRPRADEHVRIELAPNGGWIRRLMPFLRLHTRDWVLVFFAAIGSQVITAAIPLAMRTVVDDAIMADRTPLTPWLVLLVVLSVARYGLSFVRRYNGGRVGIAVEYDLRNACYDHLQRLDFARHDEMQTGQLVSRANADVRILQALLGFLPAMSANFLFFFLALALMLTVSMPLTVVAALMVPVLFFLAYRMRKVVHPSTWDAQNRAAEVANVVEEAVTGVRVVKGFGQESRELDRLVDASTTLYGARMRNTRISAKRQASMQIVPNLAQMAILGLGGWYTVRGNLTIGSFLAFMSYLTQLTAPIRMTAMMLIQAEMARAAADRIFELLDSTPTITEKPDAADFSGISGEIHFNTVSFGYMRSEPVLSHFNLHVRPGEVVALVGGSGSGKSTVAMILPRFYDVQEGSVTVDGTDVRDVKLESLRRQIGVVFEESFLFSDSIRENIAYGRPASTMEQVVAAAKAAEAHDFIMDLPDGYDTVVGERGMTLSGGQRQRVGLARALITDPRMLILDDATSSIDAKIEEEIHDTLRRIMPGRSVILVAHRRSTLDLADRIVVMDRGSVVDSGTHIELMERCPLYKQLLAGPDDSAEHESPVAVTTRTESAWSRGGREDAGKEISLQIGSAYAAQRAETAGLSGMGGGMGAMRMSAPPTPELLEQIEALPPVRDYPELDISEHAQEEPNFGLLRFAKPFTRPLMIGFLLVGLDALGLLAGPWIIKVGVDNGVVGGAIRNLWWACVAFGISTIFTRVLAYVVAIYTGRTGQKLLFSLRVKVFAHLQRLALDYYDREMAGRIMTRMTSDIEALQQLLQSGIIQSVTQLTTFFGTAIILFTMNVRLALYVMLIAPPLAVATQWFRRRSDTAYLKARDRLSIVNANFQESISGVRVAQAFVRESRNMTDFRQLSGSYFEARLEGQRVSSAFFPFVEALSTIAMVIVLGAGKAQIEAGTLTQGALIAFILYINTVFAPIQQLSQVFDTYQQAKAAMTRLGELLATKVTTPAAPEPVVPGRLRGDIRFEDVHFKYAIARDEALAGVDVHIPSGQTIALVGETGAGKSTMVKLIARFYDATGGRILVDGIPLTSLDLEAFRRQLGYVPQEPFLFSGTIRDNIAYAVPDASDESVEAAARAVGAHDFIERLAFGYHQPVTERGRSLSAGQRQLIALARALLVDPAILILDEATANLDLATEARVARAMGVLSRGRTTILIAHRLQTAQRADRILVIDRGRVVEDGPHDTLVAHGGRYAELWTSFAMEEQSA